MKTKCNAFVIYCVAVIVVAACARATEPPSFEGTWRGTMKPVCGADEVIKDKEVKIVIAGDTASQYYREKGQWIEYGHNATLLKRRDLCIVTWLNDGSVWTEHQTFSLSYVNPTTLHVVCLRHVTNRQGDEDGQPWFVMFEGDLKAYDGETMRPDDDFLARATKRLQSAFLTFPLVMPATNNLGEPVFQTVDLQRFITVDHKIYCGFRFTVPPRTNHEDLVWAFTGQRGFFRWDILPQTGKMEGFKYYINRPRADYLGPKKLRPYDGNDLYLQRLPGDSIEDGKSYLIWMGLLGKTPQQMSAILTFTNLDSPEPDEPAALEKALMLDQPAGPPVVNPDNHHIYRLLRSATWLRSEAEAVALGGHLATVRNRAEEDWIFQTFGASGGVQRLLWIGFSDTAKKFHYAWSSGEPVAYTRWAPGEPNNAGNREDFAAIYSPNHPQANHWNDWGDQAEDANGMPMNGVMEIIPEGIAH